MKPTNPLTMPSSAHRRTPICLLALLATIVSLVSLVYLLPAPSLSYFMPCHCSAPPAPAAIHTTFESIPSLENFSPEADAAWATLSTPGGGFLHVSYNESYVQTWGISMFHQLHCLGLIRGALQKEMGLANSGGHHHGGGQGAQHQDDPEHVAHCFAYLAQALKCAGDGTIEPPWEAHDQMGHVKADGVDGLGVVHRCRATGHLWNAARRSEDQAVERWGWKEGDEVEEVFRVGKE